MYITNKYIPHRFVNVYTYSKDMYTMRRSRTTAMRMVQSSCSFQSSDTTSAYSWGISRMWNTLHSGLNWMVGIDTNLVSKMYGWVSWCGRFLQHITPERWRTDALCLHNTVMNSNETYGCCQFVLFLGLHLFSLSLHLLTSSIKCYKNIMFIISLLWSLRRASGTMCSSL